MAPFRWPNLENDVKLAIEVAENKPEKPSDWDEIAERLSNAFTNEGKTVDLKGRGCKERMERLLKKYHEEDKRALKRSGTEEEYDELNQLLEDIATYRTDMELLRENQKQEKKRKAEEEKKKGEDMRRAAMEGMSKRAHDSSSEDDICDDDTDDCKTPTKSKGKPKAKQRFTKLSAIEFLAQKYERKADLKEKELEMKKIELELKAKDQEMEAQERRQKLALEMEERRAMIQLLKKQL